MNTRNLAIMSTDIVGSIETMTRLNREEYHRLRSRYEQIVVPLITRGAGAVFKSLGDGYLASFESSTHAVLAGLAIQTQLRTLMGSLNTGQSCATRIGLSSGDVDIDAHDDKFGVPVVLATRVQSIAEAFATYLTESVFLTMNRNEVAVTDLGYISLKGLEDKVRVFRAELKE